jgi:hypothetical protein
MRPRQAGAREVAAEDGLILLDEREIDGLSEGLNGWR